MERRRWAGTPAAVILTFAAAVLSLATGMAAMLAESGMGLPGAGTGLPVSTLVPRDVSRFAGFSGALTGFLLLGGALALRRGLRAGWYAAVLLLPVTAAQGVLQTSRLSYPLIALSTAAFAVTLRNRGRFDDRLDLTATQLSALVAVVGAQAYGTVGSYVLREHFAGVDAPVDAFWFTLVTGSTVGYGDVTPADPLGRVFAMTVLLSNVAAFAVALGALLTPAIESRLNAALGHMTKRDLDTLDRHVVILGYSDLTEPILEELGDRIDHVVITPDEPTARELSDRGVHVFTADPSDAESLRRARITDARAVIAATDDDASDALSVLTARELNPEVRVVAAAAQRENTAKLERAGADAVISPASIGGHLLIASALGADAAAAERTAARILDVEADDDDGSLDAGADDESDAPASTATDRRVGDQ